MLMKMLTYLQKLSGFFFYFLGSSFFVAFILLRNDLYAREAAIWMQLADLPLVLSAVIYGGLSLYLSLRAPERPSNILPVLIAIPLALFFGVILVMNFRIG